MLPTIVLVAQRIRRFDKMAWAVFRGATRKISAKKTKNISDMTVNRTPVNRYYLPCWMEGGYSTIEPSYLLTSGYLINMINGIKFLK
jgi:hypothetical protein